MASPEEIDIPTANKKLGKGWATPAVDAVGAIGIGMGSSELITHDILGATLLGTGGYIIRLIIKNRRGHETKGKGREWWVRVR